MKHQRATGALAGALTVGFVLGAIFVAGPADAAVRNLVLGALNRTTRATTLQNTAGTPLSLWAPAGKAPLTVNNRTRVANLNSDRLDGLDSTQFSRIPQTGMLISGNPRWVSPRGYVATVSCPAGSLRTGGGYDLANDLALSTGAIQASHPIEPRGWEVVGNTVEGTRAYVVCLSVNGAPVPGTNAH